LPHGLLVHSSPRHTHAGMKGETRKKRSGAN
jgi:hypothetical protein